MSQTETRVDAARSPERARPRHAEKRTSGRSGAANRPGEKSGATNRSRATNRSKATLTPLGLGLAIAAALSIVLGAAFLTGFLAPPGPSDSPASPANTDLVVRSPASAVVSTPGGGWLADDQSGTLRHFDSSSGGFVGRALHVAGTPISMASGYRRIWVAGISDSLLYAVNPATGRISGSPVTVAQGPVSVVAGDGGIWVASLLARTVSLVDPATKQVVASVALPDGAVRLAIGAGYVWVTGQTDTLTRIDPRPLGVTLQWRSVRVGQGPIGVAVGAGAVWVANAQSGTLSEVGPRSMVVKATIRVPAGAGTGATTSLGSDPQTVAFWQDEIWVGSGARPNLVAFDPSNGARIGRAVTIPGAARELYVGDGDLWATTANPGTVDSISR